MATSADVHADTAELAPCSHEHPAPPAPPRTLAESGLPEDLVAGLLLKHLFAGGTKVGRELGEAVCLPFNVIEPVLQSLRDSRLVEVRRGDTVGPLSFQFQLTDTGHLRAKDRIARCAYAGPAPVPLNLYAQQVAAQTVTGATCTRDRLQQVFQDLVVDDDLIDQLGPAVVSGKSVFLYGPPGNGKTSIGQAIGEYLNATGGDIFVPYAFLAEDGIVTVFDPTIHQPVRDPQEDADGLASLLTERRGDARWCRVRRPVVVTGGELTLAMLDLRHDPTANFYQAPLHVKANGGVFLIDDFGRQIVPPRDLLNRWILPLEERHDFLTLHNGRKFSVPFEQLVLFSTNLDPAELVDEAFLRRMRHKIRIDSPTREQFERIFAHMCRRMRLTGEPWAVEYLYRHHFADADRAPRSSDPRDLLELLAATCQYNQQPFALTPDTFAQACRTFFHEVRSAGQAARRPTP